MLVIIHSKTFNFSLLFFFFFFFWLQTRFRIRQRSSLKTVLGPCASYITTYFCIGPKKKVGVFKTLDTHKRIYGSEGKLTY